LVFDVEGLSGRSSSSTSSRPSMNRLCHLKTRVRDIPLSPYTSFNSWKGRAVAQAISRRLPTAAARVQTRVWSCGILWLTKMALGQVFSENFGFPCQSTFHLLIHNHLHYHPRLAQ
jgi:hypothetical protein